MRKAQSSFTRPAVRVATIDAAGRLSLGRIQRLVGPSLYASVIGTSARLAIRFQDDFEPPPGWILVSVISPPGRYPYLRLSGPEVRKHLARAGLTYPTNVVYEISPQARLLTMRRIR